MRSWKQYIIGITTETRHRINEVHCSRDISSPAYFYLIIKLCLFTCERQDMSKDSNICLQPHHFWINVIFSLFIKKLMLGGKTIWKSMRKFPCAVWSGRTFTHMNNEETFFFSKLHIGMIWIFSDKHLFIRPQNLKISLKDLTTNFFERKCIGFSCFQIIYTPYDS